MAHAECEHGTDLTLMACPECRSETKRTLTSKDQLDPAICGDDGPISPEQCALWLDAKYHRHGELEDRAAAMWLRKLSARPAPETVSPPPSAQDAWDAINAIIRKGDLPTNFENDQRNGMILASNEVAKLIRRARDAQKANADLDSTHERAGVHKNGDPL